MHIHTQHICIYICIHTYVSLSLYTHIYLYTICTTHIYIYVYIYIYIHTYKSHRSRSFKRDAWVILEVAGQGDVWRAACFHDASRRLPHFYSYI